MYMARNGGLTIRWRSLRRAAAACDRGERERRVTRALVRGGHDEVVEDGFRPRPAGGSAELAAA
jgi:hypothetical protein